MLVVVFPETPNIYFEHNLLTLVSNVLYGWNRKFYLWGLYVVHKLSTFLQLHMKSGKATQDHKSKKLFASYMVEHEMSTP